MKSALLCASVALVLSVCEASQMAPESQAHLSMSGALTEDNAHPFVEQVQHSMADMLAQAQGSDSGEKVLFSTIDKPPAPLLELVSIVQTRLNKAHFFTSVEPAKLPEQGYDGHDHKEVDVQKVSHKPSDTF